MEIIKYLQSFANPVLDVYFTIITMLGEDIFILAFLTYLYWNVDKETGEYVVFSLFTSLTLNGGIKDIVKAPRPIGQEGIFSAREHTATGYSFPSGHSQTAGTFFGALGLRWRKAWIWAAGIVTMLLIGISRLYLGVHYPKDVAAGLLLGLASAYFCRLLFLKVRNREALYVAVFAMMLAFLPTSVSEDFYKSLGGLAGFVLAMLFEHRVVRFQEKASMRGKVLRYLLGLAVLLCVKLGLERILPEGNFFLFLLYMAVIFTGMGLYPWLFSKWKALQ